MKLISVSLLMAIVGSSLGAFAAGGAAKLPECQAPVAACESAGYKAGAHKKGDKEGADAGLWVDCIGAVADGKKQVSGVDQAAAQACRNAAKAQRHNR